MNDNYFQKHQIAERAVFSVEDLSQIQRCRGDHNRLGYAYQMAFARLTGRFPTQEPLELIEELLSLVAHGLGADPNEIVRYARQPTVSEHQELIRGYLGLRRFREAENQALAGFVIEEAYRLEQPSSLLAMARGFLQDQKILIPASSTLRRIVGEQRERARQHIFGRIMEALSLKARDQLDEILRVSEDRTSTLQILKDPPGFPSPPSLLRLTEKLDRIRSTEILEVDLSWLNNNFQKSLARRAKQSSVWRLRELQPPHRYTVLVCFLWQTYRDTIDQVVDMHGKLITRIWRRAETELGDQLKKQRTSLVAAISMFRTMVRAILDENLQDEDVRSAVFGQIPPDTLRKELSETEDWLSGGKTDTFAFVINRFSYLRQFTPSLLEHLAFEVEAEGDGSLLQAIDIMRELNRDKKRKIPPEAPVDFIPRRLRPFVNNNGQTDRRAYECAMFTSLRDEIRRGNIWVRDSRRYGRLNDFFIPDEEWEMLREDFFRKAGMPTVPADVGPWLTERLSRSFDQFLETLPDNAYVKIEKDGWRFGTDSAEQLDSESEKRLADLEAWLGEKLRSTRLPDLLIEVDNEIHYTRHFLPTPSRDGRRARDVCNTIATIMAHGCNIGPKTMARLAKGVSYDEISRITDWHLYDETLRRALVDVVNAITSLETTNVWGSGKTSSSDGQRFQLPKKVLQRTWSSRMNSFAIEFYSFVADNYAPFYSVPIECTDRDAPFVLDGLLYHESDLDIEEHYVDTHGYTEINFAAFAMYNMRFCPRIRGLHHQWIYRIDKDRDYGPLNQIVARNDRTIHLDWISDQWDRMGQFYASLKAGHSTASVALKRLISYGAKNEFYRANRELGRIFKTEFILRYLSDPSLRRRVQRGLLKGEQLHALARNVHYGRQGKSHLRDFQQQMSTASCLILILACIVYWQSRGIHRILSENDPESDGVDVSQLTHVSPIAWDNILLYGQYVLNQELVR
ncbi:Tn3 family transposase [Thermodesulfobacteriota bacterium]